MNFRKRYWAVVPVMTLLIASCAKSDLNTVDDRGIPAGNSTFSDLVWPVNTPVESGDKTYSYLGFGFDAMSVSDSMATRAKVIDLAQVPDYRLHKEGVFTTIGSLITAASKAQLEAKIAADDFYASIRPLFKYGFTNNPVSDKDMFAYYVTSVKRYEYFIDQDSVQLRQYLTTQFKNDVNNLSAPDLVAKYGTHLLVNIAIGDKFEMLYKGKTTAADKEQAAEMGFLKRRQQFSTLSNLQYGASVDDKVTKLISDEVLVFNAIGGTLKEKDDVKLKGIINATDRNDNNVKMDYNRWYTSLLETSDQFIGPNNRTFYPSIVPLYSLVSDPVKKQALKNYILQYIKL
jgi:hypothetical protein